MGESIIQVNHENRLTMLEMNFKGMQQQMQQAIKEFNESENALKEQIKELEEKLEKVKHGRA